MLPRRPLPRTLLLALATAACSATSACSREPPAPAAPTASISSLPGATTAATPGASAAHAVDVGAMAPDFSLPGSDGKTHRLTDHRGKEAVVVAWFPKAFTGG